MKTNNQENTRRSAPFVVLALLLCLTVPLMAVPAGAELFGSTAYLEEQGERLELPGDITLYNSACVIISGDGLYVIYSESYVLVRVLVYLGQIDVWNGSLLQPGVVYKAEFGENGVSWVEGYYFPVEMTSAEGQIRALKGDVRGISYISAVGDSGTALDIPSGNVIYVNDGDVSNGITTGLTSIGELLTALFTPSGSLFPLSVTIGFSIALGMISWAIRKNKKFY